MRVPGDDEVGHDLVIGPGDGLHFLVAEGDAEPGEEFSVGADIMRLAVNQHAVHVEEDGLQGGAGGWDSRPACR
jgi:hypothetical protein